MRYLLAMPINELDKAEAWVVHVEHECRDAAVKGLRSAAHRGVQKIVAEIIPSKKPQPVDRGIYQAGWHAMDQEGGADIENLQPHAVFIEEGVRAANVKIGRAMIQALAEWAQRKGLLGRRARSASGKARQDKEAQSAAWAIAKSMQRRGIFGQHGLGILRELVEKHLEEIVREEVEQEIKKIQ